MKTEGRAEIPRADAAALLLMALLTAGWILAVDVRAGEAILLALATSLLFWAPLRLMDYLRYGRLRGNQAMSFLRLDLPHRVLRRGKLAAGGR